MLVCIESCQDRWCQQRCGTDRVGDYGVIVRRNERFLGASKAGAFLSLRRLRWFFCMLGAARVGFRGILGGAATAAQPDKRVDTSTTRQRPPQEQAAKRQRGDQATKPMHSSQQHGCWKQAYNVPSPHSQSLLEIVVTNLLCRVRVMQSGKSEALSPPDAGDRG